MYYSSIGILSLIMHVIINFDTLFRKRNDGGIKMHKKYRPFLFAVMSFYISDFLFNKHVDRNAENGGVIVAAGIGFYDPDKDSGYDEVFTRADKMMYIRKKELKSRKR